MSKTSKILSTLTIGMDLGNRSSHIAIFDRETGEIREAQVESTPEAVQDFFADYPGARVIFEVGQHSRWVQQVLQGLEVDPYCLDPRRLALISKSIKKTDKNDAIQLAQLGSMMPQALHTVVHRSPQTHADLAVLDSRRHLVDQRTALVNRIRLLVKTTGVTVGGCDAQYFFRKALPQIPAELRPACDELFKVLEQLNDSIRAFDKQIEKIAVRYPVVERLMQVDRVGVQTALHFALVVEDPKRFAKTRQIGAYLGLVPRTQDSGDRRSQLGITKAGDRDMRRLLVLVAHQMLSSQGKDSYLRRWGLTLCERGGKNAKKRAICAVARKLAVLLLSLWKSNSDYDPMRNLRVEEAA